ncbi:hypothetical protein K502DRAFT_127505 [Neoconidiobolus thromboides FSU 785]|nr:hypothetical protein K502DRAFT_127505 [Neoconidiobolus thromboides FSU 785]
MFTKAVEDISRRSFDLVQLERMNYLFPKLFKFEPIETLIHQKENTIIFPADKVDVLSRLLHLKLLFYVKKEHNEYLKNINIPVEDGLPKQWYIEFDLDQIENIPIKSLPARKTINRTLPPIKAKLSFTDRTRNMFSSVKSNNNNNKLSIYDKMYQKFKQNTMEKKQTTDSDEIKSKGTALDEANKRSKAAYERNRLEIERIRKEFEAELSQKKEEKKKLKVSQEKQQEYEKIMVKISQLPDIIQSIRVIFILKQGLRSLELDEVVGKINTKQQWKLSFQEVKDRIYLVQEVIPQFLNVNWNQQLKKYFVNINQLKISKEEVDNALEKYLEGKKKSEE